MIEHDLLKCLVVSVAQMERLLVVFADKSFLERITFKLKNIFSKEKEETNPMFDEKKHWKLRKQRKHGGKISGLDIWNDEEFWHDEFQKLKRNFL